MVVWCCWCVGVGVLVCWCVVVVEWLFYSHSVRSADLCEFFFSLIFVCKMCVVVARPMNIVTLPRNNGYHPNWLLIFLWKWTHSETKSWKSSRILTKKKLQQQRYTLEIVEELACETKCLHFSFFFHHFSPFFHFFYFVIFSIFSIFSFFHFFIFFNFSFFEIFPFFFFAIFHFLSFSFIFFHFLSFSFIFYHFLSFSFIFFFFVGFSKSDFFGPQFRYDFF